MKKQSCWFVAVAAAVAMGCGDGTQKNENSWDLTEEGTESGSSSEDAEDDGRSRADAPCVDCTDREPDPADHGDGSSDDGAYIVAIYDTSSGFDACNGWDSGSDIFAVGLEDATGREIAWGNVVADGIVWEGNEFGSTHVLDGSPPDDDIPGYCPLDFNDDTVVTLGCGGWIAVEFLDENSRLVRLDATAGQQVRVYEYSTQCSTGSIDDSYDAVVCRDTSAIRRGDDSSCDVQLILGAHGEVAGEVSGIRN